MNLTNRRHSIDHLFTILLLMCFALFTLMLTALGASVYKKGIARLNQNYTSRAAVSYVTEKIRQHEETDSISFVSIGTDSTLNAIVCKEIINQKTYLTYIYFYEDALCELMLPSDQIPDLSLGTPISSLSSFSFAYEEDTHLLHLTAVSTEYEQEAQEQATIYIAPKIEVNLHE